MKPSITTVATALGATRAVLGIGYMFAPKLLNTLSFGSSADNAPLRIANKMLGSREVYMGATVIAAARANSPILPAILAAGATADAWDSLAAWSTPGTSGSTKLTVSAVALTAAAVGALTASRARRRQVDNEPSALWSTPQDAGHRTPQTVG
ncbi:hypothetical protein ACFYO1_01510 [Nocardia sp. NPDC006044]|uniref:hypothetical protein n=1 Tax=Nocardia sp. NPDC006044 TaxID=3364306 RepID=UPI0036953F68